MLTKDFLFEIGVEEIPAGYIAGAINKLVSYFESSLKEAKLDFDKIIPYSTPRRLAIKITGLQTVQKNEIIEKIGPTKSASYDEKGNLTKAVLGFLKGANATEKDICIKSTPKGDKIAVKKEIKGKKAEEILTQIIKEVIHKIPFPKSMRWGSRKFSFARPIRWLLVLFGDKIIELEIEGVKSGNISYGNRFQKLENPVEINNINEYEKKLESVYVIPDRQTRMAEITKQLFNKTDDKIIEEIYLLDTVTDLVEYPTVKVAAFDKKYLDLPEKVVILTLSEHQKYFAIHDGENNLVNQFAFVSNSDSKYSDLIRSGNEKVIKARLEDAEFYFKEDTKQPLENYVPKLKEVTFQEKLGSLFEKTERVKKLTEYLCTELKLDKTIKDNSIRAAHLCKADLVTMMLGEKEYTKLQGYIGHRYALESGEKPDVAKAIEEHYKSGGYYKSLSKVGAIVAIADKMDTVCGIIGVNVIPTGSKDPFALRRAGNGIVQIIANQNFEIDLHKLIDEAFNQLDTKLSEPEHNKNIVYDFFKQRVNWLLKQRGIDYDVIESVMHIDHSNIPDLVHRAEALKNFLHREDFIKLVLGFKRVSNIIVEAKKLGEINTKLFCEDTEKLLYDKYLVLVKRIDTLLPKKEYKKILEELVFYGATIDKFFDDVLVNTEDMELRQNRYNLLDKIRKLFLQVADISKIVVEGGVTNKR
ncbi:MAG: glycine--tRNA ligase subunit beta [Candidatus Cloacimonetes bacterium]|nr:glycine--tRNA ligase subunit beta [Candidatus Cloacimonadota bacterium]